MVESRPIGVLITRSSLQKIAAPRFAFLSRQLCNGIMPMRGIPLSKFEGFSGSRFGSALSSGIGQIWKEPRVAARVGIGILLGINLIAAAFAFHLFGASSLDLATELDGTQRQLLQAESKLKRTTALSGKVDHGRQDGDAFMLAAMTSRRTAYSTLVAEINKSAVEAHLTPKDSAFSVPELIEGSETINILTITANFEGNYGDLLKFVNLLDKSPRFLILESIQASPQQSGTLNIGIKFDAFLRDEPANASDLVVRQ